MPKKRSRAEMESSEPPQQKEPPSLLQRIRNMWEFASVMQYIFMFGKAVKIDDDFDIEDFETECLKPGYSEKLEKIGLTLLKWISSHRGLDYTNWDEYTRRQYQAKAPERNPYGDEEEPNKFRDFDIFLKIRVLHQLTIWTFWNPDRMRERMPDHPHETQQLEWRVEEFGYGALDDFDENGKKKRDQLECQYYLLDDNRLYRRTDPPLPPPPPSTPKSNSKKGKTAKRKGNKRRKVESETPEVEEPEATEIDDVQMNGEVHEEPSSAEVDTFGGFKWECIAITLADYQQLCEDRKGRNVDINEKILRKRLLDEVIPTIEAAEERQKRKMERRERELMAMEKMAHAKRSSRIAGKMERDKQEQEAAEAERKHAADLAAAHRDKEQQEKMEQDRQSRMMTRDQRLKEREYKRILAEEELVKAAEEEKQIAEGRARGSSRQLKERVEKHTKLLEELDAEEEWTFDCSGCHKYGKNLDDGSHSVACDKCSVWQHSKCLGISKAAAEKDDFHFVCKDCSRKENEQKELAEPKEPITLKFRVTPSPAPPSPARHVPPIQPNVSVQIPVPAGHRPPSQGSMTNGYTYAPSNSASYPSRPYHYSSQPNGYPPVPYAPAHMPQQQAYARALSNSTSPPPLSNHPYSHSQQYPHLGSSDPSRPPMQNTPHHYPQHPYPPYPPNLQHTPYQNQPRPPSSHGAHPPSGSHAQQNGQPTPAARLPSPVLNRPIMSPSQGNYDVGPVAGIPQTTSFGSTSQAPTQLANGTTPSLQRPHQQAQTPSTSTQRPPSSSSSPQQIALSGVSPTKTQHPQPNAHPPTAPLPPPSNIPTKLSMSPNRPRPTSTTSPPSGLGTAATPGPHNTTTQVRSVSGTPLFPPAEKLRPSPEQLSSMGQGDPVPTPSKMEVMGRATAEAETQKQSQG